MSEQEFEEVYPLHPWEHPLWDAALADLEEHHPQRLHQMLTSGALEKFLTKQVERAVEVKMSLQSNPDLDDAERSMLAIKAIATEPSPNDPPPKDLPPETRDLLNRFNRKLEQRPSLPPERRPIRTE